MNIINNTEREPTMTVEALGNKRSVAMKDCWRRRRRRGEEDLD